MKPREFSQSTTGGPDTHVEHAGACITCVVAAKGPYAHTEPAGGPNAHVKPAGALSTCVVAAGNPNVLPELTEVLMLSQIDQ